MGKIDFSKSLLFLAPLAGYTDLPFRKVVKKFGADVTVSEMISANALIRNSKKSFKMLQKNENETPYIVQIAGSDPEVIKEAVLILNDIEGIDGIDLNCGCPVPKVVGQNAGSALLKNLPLMQKIIETIKKYSNKKYISVKSRLGFSEKIPEKIALSVQEAGADFITFHARTRAGGYKAKVDYEAVKRAKEAVKIPVIANGDIKSIEDYEKVLSFTKCDGAMIGRAAIGNPWIFHQIKTKSHQISPDKKAEIVLEHFKSVVEFYQEAGVRIFRKHLHTYSKGMKEAASFRDKINKIENITQMQEEIEKFFIK